MLTILVRSLFLVAFSIFCVRLMGKRQVGQLQPYELVVAIMIADLATSPMESLDVPLWRGVLPMLALVVLHQSLALISLKSQKGRALLSGTPTVVIRNGKVDYQALEKLAYNLNDLLEELRSGGVLSPSDVGTAVMETSGRLSVFPSSQHRPVTPADLGIQTQYEGLALTLVMDGQVEPQNLRTGGVDENWLKQQLLALGFARVQDVMLCYLDTDGMLSAQGYGKQSPVRMQALGAEACKW